MKLPFSLSFSYFLTVALLLTCSSSSSGGRVASIFTSCTKIHAKMR